MKEKRSYLIAGAIVLAITSALFAPALHAADDTYHPVVTPDITAKVSTKGERINSIDTYYPVVTPDITAKVSTKGERIDSVNVYYPVVTPKL